MGYLTEVKKQNYLKSFFTAKCGNFFEFCTFNFSHDLVNNKARKLEVAVSNLVMKNIPSSLSVLVVFSFLLFLVHFLSLAHYLSLPP